MKKHNLLIAITLGIAFISCGNKNKIEKNIISIDTSQIKQVYQSNEQVTLQLKTLPKTQIDSTVYYFDDIKIGTVTGNDPLNYPLDKEKFGVKKVKAIGYGNGKSKEVHTVLEVVSSIQPKLYGYKIVNIYPHDQEAYTQGLEFYKGMLVESTGNGEGGATTSSGRGTGKRGTSSIRQVDVKTGKNIKIKELPQEIFGEGCTVLNDKIYQLTYQNNEGYVYDANTLEKLDTFKYFQNMEGWGLTNDGTYLYMTDGSEKIYKIDPNTFELVDYVNVYTNSKQIRSVNELEWVDGKIYANFYQLEPAAAVIDPKTGAIEAVIDFTGLVDLTTYHEDRDVFNGIAYNPTTKTFFVTGKNWDKIFEVELVK